MHPYSKTLNKHENHIIHILVDTLKDINLIGWLKHLRIELIQDHFPQPPTLSITEILRLGLDNAPRSKQKEFWSWVQNNREICENLYQNESCELTSPTLNVTECFTKFIVIVELMLKTNVEQSKMQLKQLRDGTEKKLDTIQVYQTELDEHVKEHTKFMDVKQKNIEETKRIWKEHKECVLQKIDMYFIENELHKQKALEIYTDKMSSLMGKSNMKKTKLAALEEEHIQQEREMRIRKDKLEQQFQRWLIVYDEEMMQRQTQFDELFQKYNAAVKEFDNLDLLITSQQEDYQECIREKALEDQERFKKKLVTFMEMRCAKIIQRAWRMYRARRKHKKRKNTTKNKK